MTDLVVLVLVIVWAAVLTPRVIRHFREGRSHSSIDSFHEQLHLLERTGPKLVEPAYRLGPAETSQGAALAARPTGGLTLVDQSPTRVPEPHLPQVVRSRRSSWERRRVRRRRRDLLLGMIAVALLTGGLGAVHALHLLWAVTGVSALAIAGYVALVAYAQMLHAEREAAKPVVSRVPQGPTSPWELTRPRHAAGHPLPGVEVLTGSAPLAARAGYPGAWDDDDLVSCAPRHAATGV